MAVPLIHLRALLMPGLKQAVVGSPNKEPTQEPPLPSKFALDPDFSLDEIELAEKVINDLK